MIFEESKTVWAHRFDHYIKLGSDRVHHIQFASSVLIAFIITFIVFKILQRTLNKDLDKLTRNLGRMRQFRNERRSIQYDAVNTSESGEITETKLKEFGFEQVKWQRLASDVFKPPRCRMLFSTLVGFGT